MRLAVASGKGGTGKTTVVLCLALSADGLVRLQIPEDRRIAEAYSRGESVLPTVPRMRDDFRRLLAEVP